MAEILSAFAAVVALFTLWFTNKQTRAALLQADTAARQTELAAEQAAAAKTMLHHERLSALYSAFNLGGQALLATPQLLFDVHGLDPTTPPEEARNLAYLNLVLDAWQQYWGDTFKGDFSQATALGPRATYLHRLLAVPANIERWERMKSIFYGQAEGAFVAAIDAIIEQERATGKR